MQDNYVATEHILLALADMLEGKRLASYGLTKDAILTATARTIRPLLAIRVLGKRPSSKAWHNAL